MLAVKVGILYLILREATGAFKQGVVWSYWHIIKMLTVVEKMDRQCPEDLGHDCSSLNEK